MNTIRQVCAGMALIVLLAAASPARAQSTVDLVNLFDGPCERYGVPKPLALAIAGHESGGRPWAMNIAGRPVLHASKEEALAVARAALAAGVSFDIGLMQINAQWLRRYRLPLELVFEPRGNVQVGVWILAQAIKRYGLTWEAVATYHTPLERNPERGRAYAAAGPGQTRQQSSCDDVVFLFESTTDGVAGSFANGRQTSRSGQQRKVR